MDVFPALRVARVFSLALVALAWLVAVPSRADAQLPVSVPTESVPTAPALAPPMPVPLTGKAAVSGSASLQQSGVQRRAESVLAPPPVAAGTVLRESRPGTDGNRTDANGLGSAVTGSAGALAAADLRLSAAVQAVDVMVRSGRYREAARSYAQLSLRFGQSRRLYGRRFIAQVLGRDFAQATTIVAISRMGGFAIQSADLPAGNLLALVGDSGKVEFATQWLASCAAAGVGDKDTLTAVGLWLELSGDRQRAEKFLASAELLPSSATVPLVLPVSGMSPAPAGELHFVPSQVPGESIPLPQPLPSSIDLTLEGSF